jgi:hypothetical protein
MDMQQLKQMLLSAHEYSRARVLISGLNLWSTACGSSDVTTLLRQPAALLQALHQRAPGTALTYLQGVCQVLRLPAVAALLPPAELASLRQQLLVAKLQHNRRHNHNSVQLARSAAAADDAAATPPSHAARRNQAATSQQNCRQQQQQAEGAAAMDMQQLQQMLLSAHEHSRSSQMIKALKLWSIACGSSDVTTLLRQPVVLLQALQQRAPSTAARDLQWVCEVLQLPAVAALLPPAELASLLQQLQVAKQQHHRRGSYKKAQQAQSAAAAAAATSGSVRRVSAHRGSSLTLQNMKLVMLAALEPSTATQLMIPFTLWSEQCKSDDVRSLLLQPTPLLQGLRNFYSATMMMHCLSGTAESTMGQWHC